MKKKILLALCAVLLLAGFFGLQAVSESSLSFWEGAGAILIILVLLLAVVKLANYLVEKDCRSFGIKTESEQRKNTL